jgi:hypothetical protein
MNTTLSSYPLPSLVCALARERERERERGEKLALCLWVGLSLLFVRDFKDTDCGGDSIVEFPWQLSLSTALLLE